jgi:hypothetical protein
MAFGGNPSTGTWSGGTANIFVVHFDNQGLVFEFASNVSSFTISGLSPVNLSNITGLDGPTTATPLPAALPLFAGGLGALGLLGWRRKRKAAAAA